MTAQIHTLPTHSLAPAANRDSFTGPRGTRVSVFTAGRGMPVVALHCSGTQAQAWRGLVPALQGEFRLQAPDLYGYGQSEDFPGQQRQRLEDDTDLVGALLRRLDRPAHLVGHGYGGAVALQVAADYPAMLRSLTLYEPLALHLLKPEFNGHAPALRQMEALVAGMRNAHLRNETAAAARLYFDFWNGAGGFDRMAAPRQLALIAQVPRLWRDLVAAMAASLPLAACRGLRLPALLLGGSRSPGVTRLIGERLAGALPLVRHITLPGLGHLAPVGDADAVGRLVATFLRACDLPQQRRACA